jgi:signal transduction histidine kinase/ligand-binding sensor domain-containing protein
MKKILSNFFLMTALLNAPCGMAQRILFTKVIINEDKTNAVITGITQDKDGYMWFSSNGISKFDGYQVTHFINDPLNSNSIASNTVQCIYADTSNGTIWLGTNKGLDKFDPLSGMFTHYKHQLKNSSGICSDTVTAIAKDRDHFFWIGTVNGLDRLDPVTGKFEHFSNDKKNISSLSNNHINAICADHEGAVWIGTGDFVSDRKNLQDDKGGLNKFDKINKNFIRYNINTTNQQSQYDDKVSVVFEDSKGNLWIGAEHNRLYRMSKEEKIAENLSDDIFPVEKGKVHGAADYISFINEDAAGGIWIGTLANGISRYDPVLRKAAHFESDNEAQFPDNNGFRSYSSKDGLFWVCTKEGNLYKTDPVLNKIPDYSMYGPVFAIYGDANNVLWIGTSNGLIRNDRNNNQTEHFSNDLLNPSSLSNNKIFAIYEDQENRLWLGTNGGGLNLFNKTNRSFISYRHDASNKQSIINDVVYALCEDKEKNLWVGTENGLDMMDRRTGTFIHYLHNSKDTGSIGNNFVETIIRDDDNEIWIGSGYKGGINKLIKQSGKFQHYLKGRSIFSLFRDRDKTIWAGTDSGLYYMKSAAPSFTSFTDSNLEIESTAVVCIIEDAQNNLWLNTSMGIIEIDRSNAVSGVYGKRYGVAPTSYVLRAGYASPQGEIFFSANDGYYLFSENSLAANLKPPRLLVTGFSLMDQYVKPGDGGPLQDEIKNTKSLRLNYKQNTFSFDFAAIDYASPEDNQHFFMLENYDNGWHKASADRKAYYFSLPPGHYIFRVKGFNGNGVLSEKKIDILLSPPWWKTWWAYILYGLTVAGIVVGFYRNRINALKIKQQEQIHTMVITQEEERKRISRDLHDDVGTKLSALKLYLSSLKNNIGKKQFSDAETLSTYAEDLINETMKDVREMLLNLSPSVLEEFGYTTAVETLVNKINEARVIHFNLVIFGMHKRLPKDYELALYRITQELINNILKHAEAKNVSLQIGYRDQKIVLMIEDDGKGFDASMHKDGYGLKNLEARTKLLQGIMHIDSKQGKGTSVLIEVPFQFKENATI